VESRRIYPAIASVILANIRGDIVEL